MLEGYELGLKGLLERGLEMNMKDESGFGACNSFCPAGPKLGLSTTALFNLLGQENIL